MSFVDCLTQKSVNFLSDFLKHCWLVTSVSGFLHKSVSALHRRNVKMFQERYGLPYKKTDENFIWYVNFNRVIPSAKTDKEGVLGLNAWRYWAEWFVYSQILFSFV